MPQPPADLDQAYAALGLAPGDGLVAVKAAYRRQARALHPDLNPQAPAGEMARVNAAYHLLLDRLTPRPGVSPYRLADWAPRTGQREYRFTPFEPGPARPFAPQTPRRPAPAPAPVPPQPMPGLGPLAADAPSQPAPDWRPEPGWRSAPDWRSEPAFRLVGLERQGGEWVYRVEVSGRPAALTLPLRQARPCAVCQGGGRRPAGGGACPACAGRGEIVAARLLRVELPPEWSPGDRLPLPGLAPGQAVRLELRRPEGKEV